MTAAQIDQLVTICRRYGFAFHRDLFTKIDEAFGGNLAEWKDLTPKQALIPLVSAHQGNLTDVLDTHPTSILSNSISGQGDKFRDVSKVLTVLALNGVIQDTSEKGAIQDKVFGEILRDPINALNPESRCKTVNSIFHLFGHLLAVQDWVSKNVTNEENAVLWASTKVTYALIKFSLGYYDFHLEEFQSILLIFQFSGVVSPGELSQWVHAVPGSSLSMMLGGGFLKNETLNSFVGVMKGYAYYKRVDRLNFTNTNDYWYLDELLPKVGISAFLQSVQSSGDGVGDAEISRIHKILKEHRIPINFSILSRGT